MEIRVRIQMMSIRKILQEFVAKTSGWSPSDFKIEKPKNNQADYAVSVFAMAKKEGKTPDEMASDLAAVLSKNKPNELERIEASGGYVNFFFTQEHLQNLLIKIGADENFGNGDSLKGKTIMVEYTDPNPFKLFHIGHLMSNTIGEVIARLNETLGAKVLRVNYQGDVGTHVAITVTTMLVTTNGVPDESSSIEEKVAYLGRCYAVGSTVYAAGESDAKNEIDSVNKKIYDWVVFKINNSEDKKIQEAYESGKKWSLEYFEEQYKRLGTKFDYKFFESEVANDGLEIIKKHKDIFTESDGAVVFKGEDYGLHTRVFVNSKGLPTYETKELGVNKKKFELYHPDLSVIVTANEINEYFKVLLKVMSLTMPEVAEKTRHIGHGVMRLPTGKMSSRTGDVVSADSLIEQTKEKLKEKESEETTGDPATREAVAIGAIKYSILKQSPGKDIIFDFDTSLAVKGDSGPYIQYTYARLKAILAKAGESVNQTPDVGELVQDSELALVKHFLEFPDTVRESAEMIAPQRLALYLFELANLANNFYEKIYILNDEDSGRMSARLLLVRTAAVILQRGMDILGIKTPERI